MTSNRSSWLLANTAPVDIILQALTLLGLRLYVAWVFFASALTKIQSWSSTLSLFEDEYQVPLLSPQWAALLGTAAELVLPVLLVLGILTRLTGLALFMFNIVAVLSYAWLFTVDGAGGYWQHVVWGVMLWAVVVFGPGAVSVDQWWAQRRR